MRSFYFTAFIFFFSQAIFAQCNLSDSFIEKTSGAQASHLVNVGDYAYFTADDGVYGKQIWKTDGTEVATLKITDFPDNSCCGSLSALENTLIFTHYQPDYGTELWKTNGLPGGETLVKDINPGAVGSSIGKVISHNGNIYFRANDGIHGSELWVSDGTTTGTHLVKDITIGSASTTILHMIGYNNLVYFIIQNDTFAKSLWVSDGTSNGTSMVYNMPLSSTSNNVTKPVITPSGIYFVIAEYGNDTVHGIWKSDGTSQGTYILKDINDDTVFSSTIHSHNNEVYFMGYSSEFGNELWKTDGTAAGTQMIKDITPGADFSSISQFVSYAGEVYFKVGYYELWKTDGTEAGTNFILDKLGNNSINIFGEYNVVQNYLYFIANISSLGFRICKTDGTEAGTSIVTNEAPQVVYSQYPNMSSFDDKLFFNSVSQELYVTDDSESTGSRRVKDINAIRYDGVEDFTCFKNALYFNLRVEGMGKELIKSEGKGKSTYLFKDINPGIGNSYVRNFKVINNEMYFNADDGTHGQELWKTDGTDSGTFMIKDVVEGPQGSNPDDFFEYNNEIYFTAVDGYNRSKLWKTDGTTMGTAQFGNHELKINYNHGFQYETLNSELIFFSQGYDVKLIKTDGTEANTVILKNFTNQGQLTNVKFVTLNNELFFTIDTPSHGNELWKTDGTEVGTTIVKDIYSGVNNSDPRDLFVFNNKLYFTANHPSFGRELWSTDGTLSGTIMEQDFAPGPSNSSISEKFEYNSEMLFNVNDGSSESYLYKIDGASNIVLIKTFILFGGDNFVEYNGEVYFTASGSPYEEKELWKTDGTVSGTQLVKDIYPGYYRSDIDELVVYDSLLYFFADDGIHGKELWSSDGTEEGTNMHMEIIFGPEGRTYPNIDRVFYECGDVLYFVTNTTTAEQALLTMNKCCLETKDNIWVGPTSGDWHDSNAYWSRGLIPELCDNVFIPEGNTVTVTQGMTAKCFTLDVSLDAHLNVATGSLIDVFTERIDD